MEPDKPFEVLVASFGQTPQGLVKNQVLGTVLPHPAAIVPTKIPVSEVLGVLNSKKGEESNSIATKRELKSDAEHLETLEKKASSGEAEKINPVEMLEKFDLSHVPESHRERMKKMLREFTPM